MSSRMNFQATLSVCGARTVTGGAAALELQTQKLRSEQLIQEKSNQSSVTLAQLNNALSKQLAKTR